MLSLVVVVPQPPLLVPELAAGSAGETADLRAAVREAAARLAAVADEWIAVGADDGGRRTVPPETAGTFAGFGRDVRVSLAPVPSGEPRPASSGELGPASSGEPRPASSGELAPAPSGGLGPAPSGEPDPTLPLPLLVAGWLRPEGVRIRGELVAPDAPTDGCLALGRALAAEAERAPGPMGLLIVGDGAATHGEKAPGHRDDRAGPFDAGVAKALEHADPAALAALDPGQATELWAAGRAPWQVLAGATEGRSWRGELLYSAAPYGVGYHVAVWT